MLPVGSGGLTDEHRRFNLDFTGVVYVRLVPAVGHGGGRVCAEPAARPAAGAGRQTFGETAACFPGKAGEFPVDYSCRQHARQFFDSGLGVAQAARVALGSSGLAGRGVCRRRFSILRVVRFAAKDVFPGASEPIVPGGGARVPPGAFDSKPAGFGCGRCFRKSCLD